MPPTRSATSWRPAPSRILARLHAIPDASRAFPGLRPPDGTEALRWHVQGQRDYYRWALADDGRDWSSSAEYDLTDPAVAGRIPFGVTDHLARARCDGEEGWGLFEHASMGRHDPSGFADWGSVAS